MDVHSWDFAYGATSQCSDTMNDLHQDAINWSMQVDIQRSNLCSLQTKLWNRHSDCEQLCNSHTGYCDHDSAWSSIITRNGFMIGSECVSKFLWFFGLATNSCAFRKLIAFDQCVTMRFPKQDCTKRFQNGVCCVHEMIFSLWV